MISKKELGHVIGVIEKISKSSPEVKFLIELGGDGFSVDWKKAAEFQHRAGDRLDDFISAVLLDLEILSWESKNNYDLIQNSRSVNPYCAPEAYFKKKEDALAYREALMCDIEHFGADIEKLFPIKLVQYLE